jgi:hypothetical protein
VTTVRKTTRSWRILLCLRLWRSGGGIPSGSRFMKTAVPRTRVGERFSTSARKASTGSVPSLSRSERISRPRFQVVMTK